MWSNDSMVGVRGMWENEATIAETCLPGLESKFEDGLMLWSCGLMCVSRCDERSMLFELKELDEARSIFFCCAFIESLLTR